MDFDWLMMSLSVWPRNESWICHSFLR